MLWLGYIAMALVVLTPSTYSLDNAEGKAIIPDFVPEEWSSMTPDELVARGETDNLFTAWISKDNSRASGTGDFEGVAKLLSKNTEASCDLWCADPMLVQWRLQDRSDVSKMERIDVCLYLEPHKFGKMSSMTYPGFNCIDAKQDKGPCTAAECAAIGMRKDVKRSLYDCDYCPNFEVRYMCPEVRAAGAPCPTSMAKRDMDDELALLDAKIEARELEMAELQSQAGVVQKKELQAVESEASSDKLQSLLRELLATVDA